ncbi:hypothetical protein ACN47A_25235 [Myxococcus fulvus]|uniref:hypothetical protein n=1 Tax=Myxococcus fulvus TaxID=33 RepID=UPI003B9B71E3
MKRFAVLRGTFLVSGLALLLACGGSNSPSAEPQPVHDATSQSPTAPIESSEPRPEELGEAVQSATTPQVIGRIARYCGKVNNHQLPGGEWQPDLDCTSGCDVGGLAYCQKFWPQTSSIRQVAVSSKPNNVWTTSGCGAVVDDWDGTDEFECMGQPACGDGFCDVALGETPTSCSSDCGTCGNGVCNAGENFAFCPDDCGPTSACGDGACNNNETFATCPGDCVAPSVLVSTDFPTGVLRFASEEDFNSLFHAIEADGVVTSSLPTGYVSLKSYLAQFPVTSTYDVDQAEYLRDLKTHVVTDEGLRALVNQELQVFAGGKLYQFTDIGLFKVDADKQAWFKTWLAANRQAIDFDPAYKTVPGEVSLGEGQYQVVPGVIRIDTQKEKMAGSDTTPDPVVGRIALYCGKVNNHQAPGGAWLPDPDCWTGCGTGGVAYCRKFWPQATDIRAVPVSSKPNNVWKTGGCGNIIDDWDGNEEYECLGDSATPAAFAASLTAPSPEPIAALAGGEKCGTPPTHYELHTVGASFNKEVVRVASDNNWRFIFKTRKLNLYLYRSVSIKGKAQRRKKVWPFRIKYWGPADADEIVVGTDNMDLHTNYTVIPHTFGQGPRPNFKGLAKFKLGSMTINLMDIDFRIDLAKGKTITHAHAASLLNSQINSVIGGVYNNIWAQIETQIVGAISPAYLREYAAYTKRVNTYNELTHLRFILGKVEKYRGAGHKNDWVFDWNVKIGAATYKYDMRAGSFFGRARKGCNWYAVRVVVQR